MKLERLDEFSSFLEKEATSAIDELSKVAEKSRQHLQKLVYTNIVDRFDATIDHLLLENVTEEPLLSEALSQLKDNLSEGQILGLISKSESIGEVVKEKTENVLRNGVLRNRHSAKLRKLFEAFRITEDFALPRVNPSTAAIVKKHKPQNKSIPCSILGYSDWLYSRRNAIVHGGGSVSMLQNDIDQLKRLYKCDASKTVRLKIGSLTNTVKYYQNLILLIKEDIG